MHDGFDFGDALGPARVIRLRAPAAGLAGAVVVDNLAAGPAIGGVRMAPDVTLEECARLARAMTLKNAAAGLAHGGAKAVLRADPAMPAPARERLVRAFARAIAGETGYIPGPDMGTDERAMAWVHDEIGRAVGLPAALGGLPLDELGATGFGLAHAIEVACAHLDLPLAGARVVVQGYGAVGRHAMRHLAARGARLVGVADSRGAAALADGFDLARLDALKAARAPVTAYPGAQALGADALVALACEVWIPAARPDVITAANQAQMRARILAQGANIPATPEAEDALHARGVLCLPDFIVNAGGVICAAQEWRGAGERAAFEAIETRLRANTQTVLARATQDGITPRAAAVALARERLDAAMALRRFGLY